MQLTKATLAELVAALRSNPPKSTEKRKHPRVGFCAQLEMLVPGQPKPSLVRVRDISIAGIGILTHEPFEKGSEIVLQLLEKDGSPKLLRCTVTHCKKVAQGLFSIGAAFQEELGI